MQNKVLLMFDSCRETLPTVFEGRRVQCSCTTLDHNYPTTCSFLRDSSFARIVLFANRSLSKCSALFGYRCQLFQTFYFPSSFVIGWRNNVSRWRSTPHCGTLNATGLPKQNSCCCDPMLPLSRSFRYILFFFFILPGVMR